MGVLACARQSTQKGGDSRGRATCALDAPPHFRRVGGAGVSGLPGGIIDPCRLWPKLIGGEAHRWTAHSRDWAVERNMSHATDQHGFTVVISGISNATVAVAAGYTARIQLGQHANCLTARRGSGRGSALAVRPGLQSGGSRRRRESRWRWRSRCVRRKHEWWDHSRGKSASRYVGAIAAREGGCTWGIPIQDCSSRRGGRWERSR